MGENNQPSKKRRPGILRAAFLFLALFGGITGGAAVLHPDTPLPDEWNPVVPLRVTAPLSPLTGWKLARALADPQQCQSVLQTAAQVRAADPVAPTDECTIATPVEILGTGQARIDDTVTDCTTALRLAMWTQHGVQPAAEVHLGSQIRELVEIGSYNCRRMRTTRGTSDRWSSHATAEAIDISGFITSDGSRIDLLRDWDGDDPEGRFLRAVQRSSCRWFRTSLGPDYNALHADHFHLQASGWGTCR